MDARQPKPTIISSLWVFIRRLTTALKTDVIVDYVGQSQKASFEVHQGNDSNNNPWIGLIMSETVRLIMLLILEIYIDAYQSTRVAVNFSSNGGSYAMANLATTHLPDSSSTMGLRVLT